MPWLQVETAAGHTDPQSVEAALGELGAVAVWLRDAGDEPVLEPAPGETPGWSITRAHHHFESATTQVLRNREVLGEFHRVVERCE